MTVLNFAAETVFEANTTSGNVSLTRVQLETLVDGNYTTGGVALSGDNILALDVDLGNRIATKDLRYYFSSSSSTTAVASGISFYYRDYTTDPWSLLTTIYGAGYYTTTSGNFFPHQVRVIHTISGTSISGTVREYEVNSNEDIVDYGDDGSLTEKGLEDTPFGTSDPYTIPVYNDGDKSATAYVYIGNTGTTADEMLRISQAQNGTYIGIDDGPAISSDNDDFSFNLGDFDNTEVDSGVLKLTVPSVASGTYTTPILKNQDPTYWYVKSEIPENTQIATTSGVVAPTIEVRSSNTPPSDDNFHRLIWFARRPSSDDHLMLVCTDYDGTELWTYDSNFFYYTGSASESMQGWAYASNKFYPTNAFSSTYYFAVFWTFRDNSPSREDNFGYMFDINGNTSRTRTIVDGNYDGNYYRATNVLWNKNGLIYVTYRGIGTEDDRIEVYDTYLNTAAALPFGGDQSTLYSLCLADDEEDIWIIKEDENAVYRYNQNLAQQALIENTNFANLNGICEDGDGGIFIGDTSGTARKIWHYDANGNFIEVFDATSYTSSIHRMRPDYFGGVWALDTVGDRLVRFASNGTFLGQLALPTPSSLDSTFAGCWVMSENAEKLYFVDFDLNLQKTIDTTAWGGADPRSTANPSRDGGGR